MKKTLSLLLVIAMISCMLPAFTFGVSAAESINVPIAKTANGWNVTGQPTEEWAKKWTVTDTELYLNGGCDQGYYVFDVNAPAGKMSGTIKTNAASNSCNGILFALTDADNDRAFWEGKDMGGYWLFIDEGNRVRISKLGKYNQPDTFGGWKDLVTNQVDLDDKGIDVTKGVTLTAEWDNSGNMKAYVNGELYYTVTDSDNPFTGSLCAVRMKEEPVSGAKFTSVVIEPAVVEITTAEEFLSIENNLDGNYKLMNDITITEGLSYREEGKPFTGTFDGNGKTITLDFVDTHAARAAAFCSVEGNATIMNLTVNGKLESTGNSTAAVIGTAKGIGNNITVKNVVADVSFTAANSTNGQAGIVGAVEGATVNLIDCVNKGDIVGEVVGGLIGGVHWNESVINITGCSNEGDVTGVNQYADYRGAGGFIGKVNNGAATVTIKNSTNKGNVTAKFVVANAYVGHNNSGSFTIEGCSNTGKVISGGLELPAATATARDQGIWGSAGFGFNFDNGELKGSPEFHSTPSMNNWKAYINGVEATDKVTITDKGNRRVEIIAKCNGLYDGYASVTIIWEDGKYSTFGTNAPSKADADMVQNSADLIGKLTEAPVDGSTATVTNPLYQNGFEDNLNPHNSLGNLFDADAGNKYEGWHVLGSGSMFIDFQLTTATKITHYALGTGNDDAAFSDRQPAEWKFYGSVDGVTWTLLSHVKKGDNLPNVNNKLVAFEAKDTGVAYKYARLEVLSFISEEGREVPPAGERLQGVYVQIGQLKVYTCEHTVENDSCTNCGKDFAPVVPPVTDKPAQTGDALSVMIALSVVALAAVAIVVSKKRSYNN